MQCSLLMAKYSFHKNKHKKRQYAIRQTTAPYCKKSSFAVTAVLLNKCVNFLVDTGADVSLLPANFKRHAFPFPISLRAANGSNIKTHGCISLKLEFPELKRSLPCHFIVAEVSGPILGADFFLDHGLLIDVKRKRLLDAETKFTMTLEECSTTAPHIRSVDKIPKELVDTLAKHASVFDITKERPKPSIKFHIETTGIPKPSRPYRLSPDKLTAAKAEVEKEIKLGRMVRSSSSYASPLFAVPKQDGTWRFVADYTKLNSVTVTDNYTPPRIEDLLARIPHNCMYSKLDLQKAFYLIPIDTKDQAKTAVTTPFGLFEYTVMPMALKNASQTLQRYLDSVLCGSTNTIAYCDDILLFTKPEDHSAELDKLLTNLFNAGLVVNRQKSEFFCSTVKFLGHLLTQNGLIPSEDKIAGLKSFAIPKTIKQVRRFLGLINYYRKFIPHAAQLQQPLTRLMQKGVVFEWSAECQNSFQKLIEAVLNASILTYPSAEDEYVLTTDASGTAVGGTLSCQRGPLGFYSRQFKDAELNYSAYDKELTALYSSVQHFEWLLFGRHFEVQVDHKPLLHLFNSKTTCERRRRQIEYLSTFDMTITYLPGKQNVVADALSRDKSIDAVQLNECFATLSKQTILHAQQDDPDLRFIPESGRSKSSGVWRDTQNRIFVPREYRSRIISAVHAVSHAGATSTLKQIQTSYVWPRMNKEVHEMVRNCLVCQSS